MIKTQKAIQYFQNRSTNEITTEEWEFLREKGVCNGCGGKDCFISHFLASLIAPIFFEASCDKHDFGYWKGGDEARRKECDRKFLEAILWDIELTFGNTSTFPGNSLYFCCQKYQKHLGGKMPLAYAHRGTDFHGGLPPKNPDGFSSKIRNFSIFLKKVYFTCLAYLFYFSVRIGGKKYFNYK